MKLKAFIPPILWRFRQKETMKVYDCYDHALADSHTYEDRGVIEIISTKTAARRNSLLVDREKTVNDRQTVQNMFVLSYLWRDRPLDVLEIGGACGASYFELAHLLPVKINSWHVVETPSMAAAGRDLFQDDRLSFYDELDAAVSEFHPDLLIAQGVLQYLRDPLQSLEIWLEHGFAYVYLTRTVVGIDIEHPIIAKQASELSKHGPGTVPRGFVDRKTSHPLTIVPFESVTSRISVNYNVVFAFTEGEDRSMLLGSRKVTTRMVGFLLERTYL